jgi:glycosyltransferase involved in cell wall biosynthesis
MQPGGVERQLCYLINGLSESNDIVLILCEERGAFLDLLQAKVKIVDLSLKYKYRLSLRLICKLYKAIRTYRPDVLVSFHPRLHWCSILVGRCFGVRTICRFAGFVTKGPRWRIHRAFFKASGGLVAVSEGVKDSLISSLKISDSKIKVIENGLDQENIQRLSYEPLESKQLEMFNTKHIFVSVGRLAEGKRFDLLIEAFGGVCEDSSLLIIGDGPSLGTLKEKVRGLQLEDRVHFLGFQMNPYKFMKLADLFVFTPSSGEGYPNILLEAMCLGLPCVCPYYEGGIKSVLVHGENGYLVQANNAKALQEAIELFMSEESYGLKKRIIAGGMGTVALKTIRKNVNQYIGYMKDC